MIKKYDPLIYPINIYIGIDKDLENLVKDFILQEDYTELHGNWKGSSGKVYPKLLDKNNESSIIICFPEEPFLEGVVHEITHTVYRIWEHIGEFDTGNEANAYLHEWVMKCYLDFLKDYKEQNKNDTSLENK